MNFSPFHKRTRLLINALALCITTSASAAECPTCDTLRAQSLAAYRLAAGEAAPLPQSPKPSILFCSPSALGMGYVDLDYLKELKAQGFEVDYTTKLDELAWDRIRQYNVLLIYQSAGGGYGGFFSEANTKAADFDALLERYLQSGGGVFLMIEEHNIKKRMFSPVLQKRWGVEVLTERMVEKQPANLATMSRMEYRLAYTGEVLPSPVSEDVRGIWYPYEYVYSGQKTLPLQLSPDWKVVIKATPTTITERVDFTKAPLAIPDPVYSATGPVQGPPLFAVRDYGKGRIAAISTWQQYSVGSGTKYFFDREVLEKGLQGKPSDFGRLLTNSFRWLAEPSLGGKAPEVPGGYVTAEGRLAPPNFTPEALKPNAEISWTKSWEELGRTKPAPHLHMFRGLIGARTTYSGGTSTVAEYAAEAKRLGLDFLILLDEFDKLTPQKLEALKADCVKYSDDKVKLFGGFTIESNVGNRLFFFGPSVTFPPDNCLVGPNKSLLMHRWPEANNNGLPTLDWQISMSNQNNVGYYDFKRAEAVGGMRLPDCKLYSMAAVRLYRAGKLVEDVADEYLTTVQGTSPPEPVAFNEVTSVAELSKELDAKHALTYLKAYNAGTLWRDALAYAHNYFAPELFFSDGPLIQAWPAAHRVITLGGQEFVTGRLLMPSLASVTSDVGLKEIRIYNGRALYRRYLPGGAKEFTKLLLLEGAIQKNLVLIAEDINGGRAVSFPRRSWKEGQGTAVSFCSDHVNDCKTPGQGPVLLAHGPFRLAVTTVPQLPNPGETWDGGPAAARPLVSFPSSCPVLTSNLGTEDGFRFNQTPLLEFADEMGGAYTSDRDRVFTDDKLVFLDPWRSFGPSVSSKLMDFSLQFRQWSIPTVGPAPVGWSGPGVRTGVQPSLFRSTVRFKQDQTVTDLVLLNNYTNLPKTGDFFLVLGQGGVTRAVEFSKQKGIASYKLAPGDWFGVYASSNANSHIFVNRAAPVVLNAGNPRDTSTWQNGQWINISADLKNQPVKKGAAFTYELLSLSYPLGTAAHADTELLAMKKYLDAPESLKIIQGMRITSPGILELKNPNSVVEFSIPKPDARPAMTLPARVANLNPRWSVGLWQKAGYEKGDYGNGADRYTPLGVDSSGYAYVPVNVTWAPQTHLAAGHPVIAGPTGKELFIQVTHVNEAPQRWSIEVNNPTDKIITTDLTRTMALPGLTFTRKTVTLKPGESMDLQ